MEVWEDDPEQDGDDIIDNFTIPISNTTFTCNQSKLVNVKGNTDIGNLTVIYYNLTTEPTSCGSVEIQTLNTSSQMQGGNTHLVCTCTYNLLNG